MYCNTVGLNDDLGLRNEQAKLAIKYNLPITNFDEKYLDFHKNQLLA